jgi:beta-lactamase class D
VYTGADAHGKSAHIVRVENGHLSRRALRTTGFVQIVSYGISVIALTSLGAACHSSQSTNIEARSAFGRYFHDAGAVGTFVLYDSAEGTYRVYDLDRANQRFVPASTYKILNSLIALETGLVSDTVSGFVWDGVERSIPQWNRDHTLASAFEFSVVWVYQEIARDIGESRMRDFITRTGYGNQDIRGGIDTFWLSGDLRISAMEQINFLRRLHERSLPFSERTVNLVEGIMVEERGPGYVLHAKSGLADGAPHDVGWYVGFVTRTDAVGSRTYFFALQMDVDTADQIALRRDIARSILTDLDIL